ncbi:TOPRIM nucleotidyl transferase/hydrolase domain-containing protein [Phaeacidiphilus oryzae]|uniref:TOPRIM nucleotidyl transferase/hydrolase domain-containing protein n=1 Tax=Phaeacidiphilus oryzae TaxID=348818 RepID=UPI00389A2042
MSQVDGAERRVFPDPRSVRRAAGGAGSPVAAALADELAAGPSPRTVVLVEGISDQVAVRTLAARQGRDLRAEGTAVLPMGGATSIARFLEVLGPAPGVALAGLCDAAEEDYFRRGLERAGLLAAGLPPTRATLAGLGFFVCEADLEEELIRALGADRVVRVVEAEGDLPPLRTFRKQPAQQGRTLEQQLRRFLGTTSGRKIHYARVLVEQLDPADPPPPLRGLLAHL